MPLSLNIGSIRFEKPVIYRIRFQGHLDESWNDRLGDMTITTISSPDKIAVTTLEGHVADQAALSGLLNTLYDLHMPLLSVECLNEGTNEQNDKLTLKKGGKQ